MDDQNNQNQVTKNSGGNSKMIWIIIVILIIIGAVWFFMKGSSAPSNQTGEAPTTSSGQAQSTNLKALIASGASEQCTFSTDTTSGTVYISGGKMRGSFAASTGAGRVTSNMINDGQNVYMWVDNQSTGYKMSVASMPTGSTSGQNPASQGIDQNANYEYKCSHIGVDASMFAAPSNVTFNSLPSVQYPSAQ